MGGKVDAILVIRRPAEVCTFFKEGLEALGISGGRSASTTFKLPWPKGLGTYCLGCAVVKNVARPGPFDAALSEEKPSRGGS